MTITCFIRYQIDPFQRDAFNGYAVFEYRREAPHALQMRLTDEHLLPWFVVAGG